VQDPTRYLNELGVTTASLFDSSRPATIDPAHLISLNYETFLFADQDERIRFKLDPTEYCGPLTDPVTLQRFVPVAASPHLDYDNRTYYFWSDSTRSMFEIMPDMYAAPHHRMRPKPDSVGSDTTVTKT
jgi:YHS domain-containing protein